MHELLPCYNIPADLLNNKLYRVQQRGHQLLEMTHKSRLDIYKTITLTISNSIFCWNNSNDTTNI